MSEKGNGLEKLLDVIGGIAAIVTVIAFAVKIININFGFIPEGFIADAINFLYQWGALIVVGITGWEFVANKGLIAFILYAALVAVVVIFMFFPATWAELITYIPVN